MDDKTLQALTELAAKLGTTAEYLWGVLIKQAPISGVIDLLVMSAAVALAVFWCRFVFRKTAEPPKSDDGRWSRPEWDNEGAAFAWLSVVIVGGAVATLVGARMEMIVAALVNPEYWALRQILK